MCDVSNKIKLYINIYVATIRNVYKSTKVGKYSFIYINDYFSLNSSIGVR